jgi:gamma-tubulin complex component 3
VDQVVVSVAIYGQSFCCPNFATALQYSDIAGLERSIDTAYLIASQRLFDIFFEKFKLLDHLKAVKHYLMLGHGDFADQLMESLGYA